MSTESPQPTLAWRDVSSFSQGEKDRTPHAWQLQVGAFRISVHRHIHWPKDAWLVTCPGVGYDCLRLVSIDQEDAKAEAVALVRGRLQEALDALGPGEP